LTSGLSDRSEADPAAEDRARLDSAVKRDDGFFTTFFVSPYSKYIARWAARRGLSPNQVTVASMIVGLLAAAAFATGERWGLVCGAVLLQLAFTLDCVDGQLARYTRTFSPLGAWMDSMFDRTKEYVVFAGLAIGASRMGEPVWLLACAAIAGQTVRHMADLSFAGAQPRAIVPDSAAQRALTGWRGLDRAPGARWIKRILTFPIGERFAAISLTAALFTPHTTFVVVLAGIAVGALYTETGRVLRSVR
jgi:phosphatidylglycerophosphate synthase